MCKAIKNKSVRRAAAQLENMGTTKCKDMSVKLKRKDNNKKNKTAMPK